MIKISDTSDADTRTVIKNSFCPMTKERLLDASERHIEEVRETLNWIADLIISRGENHDWDKLASPIFVRDFLDSVKENKDFTKTEWYESHYTMQRHHRVNDLKDVTLIDLLEYIVDFTTAKVGRTRARSDDAAKGIADPIFMNITQDTIVNAFYNTVHMVENNLTFEN